MAEVLRHHLSQTLAVAALALPSPVLAGDWPDPTLIFDRGEHVALTTTGEWAPSFRVLRSPDLASWRITGEVFRRPPRWVQSTFWAPEITRLGSGFAVFYSALPKTSKTAYCLGVAFAPAPEGPWRDLGRPLRCGRSGSIDPFPVRDENGRLNLLWKSNANRFGRPTPIYAQRLSEDARRLEGRPRELIRNTRRWEKKVVEAPAVIRRDGFFYLFYSGALCCTRPCDYAVGVARSTTLLGPWRKFAGNPILRDGNGWRCPGHADIAEDAAGNLTAVFHAYRARDGFMVGRQLLTAPLTFDLDGWPQIGDGRPPAPTPGAGSLAFTDDFSGPLASEWEWPLGRVPGRTTGPDGLTLRAPRRERDGQAVGDRLDGAVLARRLGAEAYTASAVIDRASLEGDTAGGISSYKNANELIGLAVDRRRTVVWRRSKGRGKLLLGVATPRSDQVHLRMVARGRRFTFQVSPDGVSWRRVGRPVRSPVTETARFVLTAGGERRARVRFLSAAVAE